MLVLGHYSILQHDRDTQRICVFGACTLAGFTVIIEEIARQIWA
jgi:hypothetical protein